MQILVRAKKGEGKKKRNKRESHAAISSIRLLSRDFSLGQKMGKRRGEKVFCLASKKIVPFPPSFLL